MILVTGGAGSIGSEVVRRLVRDGESVRVMDINEEGLWALKCELPEIDIFLGDVTSLYRCIDAIQDCSGVVHCAALKHVDLCQQCATLTWHVNLHGTETMLRAANDLPFVLVSTDKAIQPISFMGKSKKDAENKTLVAKKNVVRLGNVIGTRGSLLPMVRRCAELGKPIPLTDPSMTRWMMDIEEAVDWIVSAMQHQDGQRWGRILGPIFPRAVNIGRFVELCRDELAPNSEIIRTGMRPGERLHEPIRINGDGQLVWSDDPAYQASDDEMLALIGQAVAA